MDEFNKNGSDEFNKSVNEFKAIEAIEYYVPKEVAKAPQEIVGVNESFDPETQASEDLHSDVHSDFDEFRERVRNLNSDGTHATQPTGVEATSTGGAGATSSGGAVASTSSVVASSASLAGGVSIIVAAAAVVVGSNVLNDPPKITNESISVGTDYCLYEFDVDTSTLQSGCEYTIELTNIIDTYSKTINPNETHQRLLFTGLTKSSTYSYRVVAKYNKLETYYYDLGKIRTNNPNKPTGIFEFTPQVVLEEDGTNTYNLDYSLYVSNMYGDISQSFISVSYANESFENDEIDKKNFIKGTIFDVTEGETLQFFAFTYYANEMVLIAEESFNVTYPDNFIRHENFNSSYVFNADSISDYTYNVETGSSFKINTGFDNSNDSREAMKFDIIDNDDNVISSFITQDAESTIELEPMYNNGTIQMTPIKYKSNSIDESYNGLKKLDDPSNSYYSFEPVIVPFSFETPFAESSFNLSEDGLSFGAYYSEEPVEFNLVGKIKYKDGTEEEINEIINSSFVEYNVTDRANFKEEASGIELQINHTNLNGDTLGLFRFKNEFLSESIEFGEPSFQDGIDLPYKINLPKGSEYSYGNLSLDDGTVEEMPLEVDESHINLFEITSPNLSGLVSLEYRDKYGVSIGTRIPFSVKVLSAKLFGNVLLTPSGEEFEFSFDYRGSASIENKYDIHYEAFDNKGNSLGTYDSEFTSTEEVYSYNNTIPEGTKSISVSISFNEELIYIYSFELDSIDSITQVTDLEIDDDGNVLIPYSVKEIAGYDLSSVRCVFDDGTEEEISTYEYEGYLKITELNANILNGKIIATYYDQNTYDELSIGYLVNMNLNAVVSTDYFVPFNGSNVVLAIKYDVQINGKTVNMDLGLEVLSQASGPSDPIETVPIDQANAGEVSVSSEMLAGYKVIPIIKDDSSDYYLKNVVSITANGFEDLDLSIKNVEISVLSNPSEDVTNFNSFDVNSDIVVNRVDLDDGTSMFLIDTAFVDSTDFVRYQRFVFEYVDEYGVEHNIVKTSESESQQKFVFTLPTRDYVIGYDVITTYNNVDYSNDIRYIGVVNKKLEPSVMKSLETDELYQSGNNIFVKQAIDLSYVDVSKPISLTYNEYEYEIPYYESSSSYVTDMGTYYEYKINSDGYQLVIDIDEDSIMHIELTILEATLNASYDEFKIHCTFVATSYINYLNETFDVNLDAKDFGIEDSEIKICSFETQLGTYDLKVEDELNRQYYLKIPVTNKASNESFRLNILANGAVIYSENMYETTGYIYSYIYIPYYVSEFMIQIDYLKEYDSSNPTNYGFMLLPTQYITPVEFSNLEITESTDKTVKLSGYINSGNATYVYYREYGDDGTYYGSSNESFTIGEDGYFEVELPYNASTSIIDLSFPQCKLEFAFKLDLYDIEVDGSTLIFTNTTLDSDTTDGLDIIFGDFGYGAEYSYPAATFKVLDSNGDSVSVYKVTGDGDNTWRCQASNGYVCCEMKINDNCTLIDDDNLIITFKQEVKID